MLNDTSSALAFLQTRKSGSAKALGLPGPDASQIDTMLAIATRVPDHGKLAPWRFVLFEGEARARIGDGFAAIWAAAHPGHGDDMLAYHRNLFLRAPVVIAVVSKAAPHAKIPEFEQLLSAAAAAYNLVLAANALGFHAQWQSDWVAYDSAAAAAMGLMPPERIADIVYIGTASAPLEDRPRPDHRALTTRWGT